MPRIAWLLVFLVLAQCRPAREEAPSGSRPEPQSFEEEPLETATIGSEEVQTLPEERAAPPANDLETQRRRPCGWSSAWVRPDIPDPLLAGVGGTPMPTKIGDAEILLPMDDLGRSGEMVGEIVIDPEGDVMEVTIVKPFEPRWPEAEEAFMAAARQWKYEPPRIVRTEISLCTTILIRP